MGQAKLRIPAQFLADLLHLPYGAAITDSLGLDERGILTIVVSHPDIPVAEDQLVDPRWEKRPEQVIFLGWFPEKS